MRKLICMLCAAAMAVALFGCKPDVEEVNSKDVLSNSLTESTAEVSSEMESSAEKDSTDSSIESDLIESEETRSEPEYDALPEVIETLQICELDDDGNYVPLEIINTAWWPDRVFLAINSEIGNWPVRWSSSDDVQMSIDENGVLFHQYLDDFNTDLNYRGFNITATLPTGDSVTVCFASGIMEGIWGIYEDGAKGPEGIKYFKIELTDNFKYNFQWGSSNMTVPLADKSFEFEYFALFSQKYHFEESTASELMMKPNGLDEDNNYYDFLLVDSINQLNLEWISSNPSVATIDNNGVVTLHKKGRALIKVIAKDELNGKTYSNEKWLDYMYVNVV